jgi:hypothetical protein
MNWESSMTTPAEGTPSAGAEIANCSPGVSTACTAVEVPTSNNAVIKLPIIFFTDIPLNVYFDFYFEVKWLPRSM